MAGAIAVWVIAVLTVGGGPAAWAVASQPAQWLQFQAGPGHVGTNGATAPAPPLKVAWRFTEPRGETGLLGSVVDRGLVVALGEKGVYAVNADSGTLAWQLHRSGGPLAVPAIARVKGADLLLFTEGASATRSRLVGVDLTRRDSRWIVPLQDVSRSGITVEGGRAFLADRSGTVYAIDLAKIALGNGAIAWKRQGPGVVEAPPVVADGKVVVVFRDTSNGDVEVAALNATTGKPAWSTSSVAVFGSALSVLDGEVVEGFAGPLTAEALRLGDGVSLWSARVRSPFFPENGSAVAGGDAYVVASCPGALSLSCPGPEAGLYRIDGRTGHRIWDFEFDAADIRITPRLASSPVVVGRFVFLGLTDGRLEAVDLTTGIKVGEISTGSGPLGPLAVGDGMLFASKFGLGGGIVAIEHDPSGTLLHVVSPTTLNLGRTLEAYGLGFVAVAAAGMLLWALGLLRRRRGGPAGHEPRESEPARTSAGAATGSSEQTEGPGVDGTSQPPNGSAGTGRRPRRR